MWPTTPFVAVLLTHKTFVPILKCESQSLDTVNIAAAAFGGDQKDDHVT